MQNKGTLGAALGLLAAVCYGFIPLLTKPLQTPEAGSLPMSSSTILFYRFGLAALVVAGVMLMRRISFRISYPEFVRLTFLAFLSDGAALFLIAGYPYMNSGVATTIHFMYPVMTALLMMTFFHERRRISTFLAVGMAVLGVGLLSWSDSGAVAPIGIVGALLRFLSDTGQPLPRVDHQRGQTHLLRHGPRCHHICCLCVLRASRLRLIPMLHPPAQQRPRLDAPCRLGTDLHRGHQPFPHLRHPLGRTHHGFRTWRA